MIYHIVLETLIKVISQEKKRKGIQTGKEEIKLSLFSKDIILHLKNSNKSIQSKQSPLPKSLLKLRIKFSKVTVQCEKKSYFKLFIYTFIYLAMYN